MTNLDKYTDEEIKLNMLTGVKYAYGIDFEPYYILNEFGSYESVACRQIQVRVITSKKIYFKGEKIN